MTRSKRRADDPILQPCNLSMYANQLDPYILICPVMPYLSNVEVLVEMTAPFADTIWVYPVRMKQATGRNWRNVYKVLQEHYPDLLDDYKRLAFEKEYPYWDYLRRKLENMKTAGALNLRVEA